MPNNIPDPSAEIHYVSQLAIHEAFLAQVKLRPQSIAISSAFGNVTYQALEGISRQIAVFLQEGMDASRPNKVLILSDRNPALIYSMLAVLRSGAAFCISDYHYPVSRTLLNLEIIQPTHLLVCGDIQIPQEVLTYFAKRQDLKLVTVSALLDEATNQFKQYDMELNRKVDSEAIAYINFTSGTTARPKAVITSHSPLVHFIDWHVKEHGFTVDDRFSMISGLGHDPLLRDIFTPLSIGASIYIPDQSTVFDPSRLFDWFRESRISVCHLTPSHGEIIAFGADKESGLLNDLKRLFWGGDVLSQKISQQFFEIAPNAIQTNFYGSTETPQAVGFARIFPLNENIHLPIGKGISDAQLLVMSGVGELAAPREVGEVWVRTPYLSKGYLNDSDLTQKRFVANPYGLGVNDLCYRTGDLGMYDEDGNVLWVGRLDHQIKVRGYRVEPAAIARTIEQFEGVTHAIVTPVKDDSGRQFLVAYYTVRQDLDEFHHSGLLSYLKLQLPEYMMPTHLESIEKFPMLPNGKVDIQSLPFPHHMTVRRDDAVVLTETERQLVEQIGKNLGLHPQDLTKSYADLGGDSLSYIRVSMAVEKVLGWLPDNWDRLPLSELAAIKKRTNEAYLSINTTVLGRAIAMVAVVFVHYKVFGQVGITSALFVLAGWSFGRYQINSIYTSNSTKSAWLLIAKIAVPTALFVLFQQLSNGSFHLSSIFFLDNLFDPSGAYIKRYYYYWFINVLLQILVFVTLLFTIKPLRAYAYHHQFKFGLIATALSIVFAYIGVYVWDSYLNEYLQPTEQYGIGQLPHIKMWLFFLGIAIASLREVRERVLLITLLLLFYVLTHFVLGGPVYITLTSIPIVALIILKEKIAFPRRLLPIVNNIAGASLFIYLGEKVLRHFVRDHFPFINSIASGLITLVLCVAFWHFWEFISRKLLRNLSA